MESALLQTKADSQHTNISQHGAFDVGLLHLGLSIALSHESSRDMDELK